MRRMLAALLCLVVLVSLGQDLSRARLYGADFDVLLHVVDDEGRALPGAKCAGWIYLEQARGHGKGYAEESDSEGYVHLSGKSSEWVRVIVRKDGFYPTRFEIKYPERGVEEPLVDGKWQPYGATRTVVLKRIKEPVPLVRAPAGIVPAAPLDAWHGFDLVRKQWMPPLGDGQCEDVLIRQSVSAVNDTSEFRVALDVCFTNVPYAGVLLRKKDGCSERKTAYRADKDVEYKGSLSFVYERRKGLVLQDSRLDEESYLIFRIRTKVDEKGRLVSAHYGRIDGPWEFFGTMRMRAVYFNPKPNDTNLEDDETVQRVQMGRSGGG